MESQKKQVTIRYPNGRERKYMINEQGKIIDWCEQEKWNNLGGLEEYIIGSMEVKSSEISDSIPEGRISYKKTSSEEYEWFFYKPESFTRELVIGNHAVISDETGAQTTPQRIISVKDIA